MANAPNGLVNAKSARHKSKGQTSYTLAHAKREGKYKQGRGVGPFVTRFK